MRKFETFEHGADIGIRGYGKTLEEAFSNALKALSNLIIEDVNLEDLKPDVSYSIELKSEFLDELFVIFINKVLTLFYLEKVLFLEFKGEIKRKERDYVLKGELSGIFFDPEKFGYGVEVKGATFTLAEVKKEDNLWIAQCVVDV